MAVFYTNFFRDFGEIKCETIIKSLQRVQKTQKKRKKSPIKIMKMSGQLQRDFNNNTL